MTTISSVRLGPWRRAALIVGAWIAAIAAAKLLLVLLERQGLLTFDTPLPPIVLGVIIGLTYGLLAVGLVLIYRTSKIINFAHGQIGAFGAAIFGLVVVKYHLPYWLMLPVGLLVAAAIGAATEAVVIRRLRNAPRLMSVVATLGVAQFLILAGIAINPEAVGLNTFFYYPSPPGLPGFTVGALRVGSAYTGILLLAPVAVACVTLFLRFSRFGLALRASSDNLEAARMSGVFASRMSGLAWAIAGALSGLSAILTLASQGYSSGESFGPTLLLRALAGAVLARMNSLPAALVAGIGIGVVEQLMLWNFSRAGVTEMALFVLIMVVLMFTRQRGGRAEEKGSWAAVEALHAVPDTLRRIWLVRNLSRLTMALVLIPALTLPLVATNSTADRLTGIIAFAIVGLAVGMLTGLGGELTLGQFAVGGLGAVTSYLVSAHTGSFPLGLLAGGGCAALVSVVLGLPALRVRGLMLAVTTLAFALAAPAIMTAFLGSGRDPGRPILPGGQPVDTGRGYYWLALALLLATLGIARNVRRSGFGRLLSALRDNEDNARAFTVSASGIKLRGYLIAGFIAGIGGAVYGHSLLIIDGDTFPVGASISIVVITVVGGVAVLTGPILGAGLVIGVPAFLPLDAAGLAATQLGLLVIILYVPGGLAQIVGVLRDRTIRLIAWAANVDYDAAYRGEDSPAEVEESAVDAAVDQVAASGVTSSAVRPPEKWSGQPSPEEPAGDLLLGAADLRRWFGGVHAVDGVSLEVRAGETVGLIGPNGAGKTTTFELLSGFTSPDSGRVHFDGVDVTSWGPERRAKRGLIRSFQDAALFPTMTVTECVMVALERTQPTSFLASVTGGSRAERRKARKAAEMVGFMGLARYRDIRIRELSTGTRRIADLACLIALEPRLLLLDEPASGIAQRETEALGRLICDLKTQLGLTLLVIEHDMPLVMGISDRIIVMANGQVIKTGSPAEIAADPVVADAYLGRDSRAIERSGVRRAT